MTSSECLLTVIQKWCQEAQSQFGDDFTKVRAYLEMKEAGISIAQRSALQKELNLTGGPPISCLEH